MLIMIVLHHPPRTNRPPRYSWVRTSQLQWTVWLRPRHQIYWIRCVLKSIQHYVRNGLNSSPASFKGRSPIPVIDLMPPVALPIVSVNCVITAAARSQARAMAANAQAQDSWFQFPSAYRRKSAFLGAFAKLRRATIGFVVSVRTHGKTRLPLNRFSWNLSILKKSVQSIQVSLKSDNLINKDEC